ncbi:MAG TPA: L-threonylcarbamoyladenylate synthase [Kofleriaceae bacterium]|nr:L-threonylcarbamoyladenylate synthase [Kofleriaceae bacterium]
MKIIPIAEAPARATEIAQVLTDGGLACFPVNGTYRLAADATSDAAITRLAQSKRRARNHPALVLVSDLGATGSIVDGASWAITQRLAGQLWPGPLTLALPPSNKLSAKLRKLLARATGTIGVRVPDDPLAAHVLRAFGRPLLLSSANLERKPGASSAATVRQRFVGAIDVWVDAGDISPTASSTIVELTETSWKVVRDGAVPLARLERAAAAG